MKRNQQSIQAVDTPRYPYWQALYRSFYSLRLYADVGLRWQGFGLLYLLLLVSILCIPVAFKLQHAFDDYYHHRVMEPLAALPEIVVRKGTVFFDKPMPYYVRDTKGHVMAIIDTTGKIKQLPTQYPDLHLLITAHTIFYRHQPISFTNEKAATYTPELIKEQKLTSADTLTLSGETLMHALELKRLYLLFSVMLYPGAIGGSYAVIVGFLLTFALLGQIVASTLMKCKIRYSQSARLIMVSSTPLLVLIFGLFFLNKSLPAGAILHGLLLCFYFCFAVLGVKRAMRGLVRA